MHLQANAASSSALNRGRGRPSLGPHVKGQSLIRPQGMIFKQQSGSQVLVPANYQLSGNQVFQVIFSAVFWWKSTCAIFFEIFRSIKWDLDCCVLGCGRQRFGRSTGRYARNGLCSIWRPGAKSLAGNGATNIFFVAT